MIDRTRNDVVVAGADGALTRVSLRTLTAGERLENAHDGAIEAIAISRDGRMLATGGRTDGQVLLRDAQSFGLLFVLPPRTAIVKDLEFDAERSMVGDGRRCCRHHALGSESGSRRTRRDRSGLGPTGAPIRPATNLAEIAERVRPEVPTVWPGGTDPTEIEAAKGLFESGLEFYRQGRLVAAIEDLQRK